MHVSEKHKVIIVSLLLLAVSYLFWVKTRNIVPKLDILDDAPHITVAKLSSLGDDQLFFRTNALMVQLSGDSFGRFTPLKDYDYPMLLKWFSLFDEFDSKTNFTPSIAAYYYSNTQRASDCIYIIEYLENNYDRDPSNKWWWLSQAIYLANHRLKDRDLALRLAFKLANTKGVKMPRWAEQMPALIYAQMGKKKEAMLLIQDLLERYDDYSRGELNYMNFFIRQQLGYLGVEVDKEAKYENIPAK